MALGLAAYVVASKLLGIVQFKLAVIFIVVHISKPLILRYFEDLDHIIDILVECLAIFPLMWSF